MKIPVAALLLLAVVVVESVPKEKLLLRKYKSGKDAPKAWYVLRTIFLHMRKVFSSRD